RGVIGFLTRLEAAYDLCALVPIERWRPSNASLSERRSTMESRTSCAWPPRILPLGPRTVFGLTRSRFDTPKFFIARVTKPMDSSKLGSTSTKRKSAKEIEPHHPYPILSLRGGSA